MMDLIPRRGERGTFYFSRWYDSHRDDQSERAKPLRAGFRLHTLQHANGFVDGLHVGGGFTFLRATERFGPDPRAAGQISLRQTGRFPPADKLAPGSRRKRGLPSPNPAAHARALVGGSRILPKFKCLADVPATREAVPPVPRSGRQAALRGTILAHAASSGGKPRRRFSAGIASSTAVCSSSSTSPRYSESLCCIAKSSPKLRNC